MNSFTYYNLGTRDGRGGPLYMFTIWSLAHGVEHQEIVRWDGLFEAIERLQSTGLIDRTRRRERWQKGKGWVAIDSGLMGGEPLDSTAIFREADRDFPK